MTKIDGKTIWITGASSGIGEALTYALDKKNCKLIISARRLQELKRVKANCLNENNISILELDIADIDVAKSKVNEAISKFGQIDFLINNAGISQRSLIIDTDIAVDKKLMDVNYLGTVALSKAVLPHFIKGGSGHFVTVSSLMGKFGSPYRSGYCGAKHALHGFFDVLRMEHEKDGIAVTLICPGFINTNVAKNALTGSGNAQEHNDTATENGISAELCAKEIIKAIERRKYEAYIGRKEKFAVYVKRFFPKLLHRLVLNIDVR
ncbi:SDR family oxidoreductase [Aurantibacter crassamenti]|uniref:SDR family oxidoreductase n=1 Tax=Aurantibacter crassamenti TaxID=1837375 RepID=UPI00193AA34C|nr:SDR family oxidoreductase [Aurantibacter crassamenti]MBM1107416.1 SDR family oxidoreductase [Aurantibacter crassamenti]